jgi:hypothetical protein
MKLTFTLAEPEAFRLEAGPNEEAEVRYQCVLHPGGLVGVGDTPSEARISAVDLLKWTMEETPAFEIWYKGMQEAK